ncbi:MAG: aminopeptidase P family protein [Chitinispirillaceae bacterium]
MLQYRLITARQAMREKGCSHLLVTDAVTVEYLCGFSSSRAAICVAPKDIFLCTDFRYREAAVRFCKKNGLRFVLVDGNVFSFLAPIIPPGSTAGFQSDVVTVDEMATMKKALRRVRFVRMADAIAGLTISKTAAEITAMEYAACFADRAFTRLLRLLKQGVTERETAANFDRLASGLGSERPAFETIVLFGERTSLPHGKPGGRKLKKGDFVLVDAGCTIRGLCSDMTRTVVYGKPSPRQEALYGTVRAAQAAALRAARAGIAASSLDAVGRSVIEQAGYGAAFGHGLGHGVGRRVHERPRISAQSEETLREGSVITIEPGIYLPGFGGVRIEDMVVLSRIGSKLLTHSPKELVELSTES